VAKPVIPPNWEVAVSQGWACLSSVGLGLMDRTLFKKQRRIK